MSDTISSDMQPLSDIPGETVMFTPAEPTKPRPSRHTPRRRPSNSDQLGTYARDLAEITAGLSPRQRQVVITALPILDDNAGVQPTLRLAEGLCAQAGDIGSARVMIQAVLMAAERGQDVPSEVRAAVHTTMAVQMAYEGPGAVSGGRGRKRGGSGG